jgi:serine/threonine-protein kinase ATR
MSLTCSETKLLKQGKTFEVSEKVPFRLSPNLVDALGATGVDGVFRRACEIAMELLRENKDSLISVLEAFIHDPLVEWQEAKRREVSRTALSSRYHTKRISFAGTAK